MALFSLILVLLLERARLLPGWWRLESWWQETEQSENDRRILGDRRWAFVLPLLPAVATGLLLALLEGFVWGLATLTIWVVVLAAVMGDASLRDSYLALIRAGCREDLAALAHHDDHLREAAAASGATVNSLSTTLFWLNFRYYGAIILLAALGSPVLVVAYVSLCHVLAQRNELAPQAQRAFAMVIHAVDSLLVRIAGLLYVFVGDFARSFPLWLQSLYHWREAPSLVLGRIATAAADREALRHSPLVEACHSVTLAKRQIVGLLVVVAVLTIYGWVI
ncbi:MAG: regulatory signaling modulator protein AmpE [Gammaproteobacteria bacterium]|nr:regulatory signaling modulator protein AmpE [Gammaproteobacteria bacterium]